MNQIIDTRILSDLVYRKVLSRIVASQISTEGVNPNSVSKIVSAVLNDMEITFSNLKLSLESEDPYSEKYAVKSALVSTIERVVSNYTYEHVSLNSDDEVAGYAYAAEAAAKETEESGVDAIIADMLKFKDNVDVQYAAKFILGLIKDTQDDKLKHELDEDKLDDEDADMDAKIDDDGGLADMDGGDNKDSGNPFDGGGNDSNGNDNDQPQGDQSNPFDGGGNGGSGDNGGGNAPAPDNNVDNTAAQNAPKRESNPFA